VKLAYLASGERQFVAAMRHVTGGRGGHLDGKMLLEYLLKCRRATCGPGSTRLRKDRWIRVKIRGR
jgi:hypothetical protein